MRLPRVHWLVVAPTAPALDAVAVGCFNDGRSQNRWPQ